jgi:hypothetical protein
MTTLAGSGACTNSSKSSYEAYVWDQRRRDKVVLVGANDGMLHAFLSGRYNGTEPCVGGVPTPERTDSGVFRGYREGFLSLGFAARAQ